MRGLFAVEVVLVLVQAPLVLAPEDRRSSLSRSGNHAPFPNSPPRAGWGFGPCRMTMRRGRRSGSARSAPAGKRTRRRRPHIHAPAGGSPALFRGVETGHDVAHPFGGRQSRFLGAAGGIVLREAGQGHRRIAPPLSELSLSSHSPGQSGLRPAQQGLTPQSCCRTSENSWPGSVVVMFGGGAGLLHAAGVQLAV